MTQIGRERFLEGIKKYSSLIHLKVNGKEIDIAKELSSPKKNMSKVTEEDTIEISGPMMIDGLHMDNSSNPDRKKYMNARTRFFFEFAAS